MERSKLFSTKGGFTLIELLISVTIFTVIIAAFVGMLIVITNVGTQQSSSSVVTQESNLLLQKIQYYVATASLINIATSTPTSTLQLRMASSSVDPTFITLTTTTTSGVVYLQQTATGPLQALTSNRVYVSSLTFTRQANPPGHDVVNVSFTMQNKAGLTNIAQSFGQLFQSSIVHVSAATFDSGVLASGPGELLGNSTYPWNPINGVINFSSGNVGIGATETAPTAQLEVNGGIQFAVQNSAPACTGNPNARGTLWFVDGTAGTKDSLSLCADSATGTLTWETLY